MYHLPPRPVGYRRPTAAAAPPPPPGPVSAAFDFRATVGFVSDPPGYTFNGGTGWDQAPTGARDRSNTVDHRLAGCVFIRNNSGQTARLRIPLAAGTYQLRAAFGDATTVQRQNVELWDGGTKIATVATDHGTAAGTFLDATGVARSAAAWPGSNQPRTITVNSGALHIRMGLAASGLASTTIATLQLTPAGSPSPTPPPQPPPPPPPPPPSTGQPEPPAFTPTRTLPAATTWTELQIALANLQPGDRLPCHGVIFPPEAVFNKRLTAPAELVFDSACKANGGKALHTPAVWFENVAHLRFIAQGMIVTNPADGQGIQYGGAADCVFDGFDVRDCGGGAMGANPTNAPVVRNYIRATVRDWGLVPSLDNHVEKGTGLHGLLVETSHTAFNATDNTFVVTTPGSKVGGSLLEVGSDNSAMVPARNTAWLQAANLEQNATIQTAANALNLFGYIDGLDVLNVTANDLHGFAVHVAHGTYTNVKIETGTATYCCLNPRYAGQNPWMKAPGITYAPGPFTPQP